MLLGTALGGSDPIGRNLARLMFDPNGAQPFLANFDVVRRQLLWRIQREVLSDPDAERNAGSPR